MLFGWEKRRDKEFFVIFFFFFPVGTARVSARRVVSAKFCKNFGKFVYKQHLRNPHDRSHRFTRVVIARPRRRFPVGVLVFARSRENPPQPWILSPHADASHISPAAMVALDVEAVSRMSPGRFFRDHASAVNALDFHHTEDALVTTGDDDAIHLYNTNTGVKTKTLYSKKYGCSNVCFTHSAAAVIYSSRSKGAGGKAIDDHAVRYHSLHDNTYLRYFKGHTDAVTSIAMSATNDNFLTASADLTVRLWDLRTPKCCAAIPQCPAIPYVAYDSQGEVFAVTEGDGAIKLYGTGSYSKGAFAQFDAFHDRNGNYLFNPNEPPPAVSCVKFSPSGERMLVVSGNFITILNAFNGEHIMRIRVPGSGEQQHAVTPMEASFSPDGEFVVSGGADSRIHVWSANTGFAVSQWRARHAGLPTCVKWAPNMMLVASGCTEGGTALWCSEKHRD